ncbi:hypothetical protein L249_8629 [Ophiocordyceps polyrhachis-furcata BCC 54312]|uniref:Mannan endo-1,6-alpha-mannosidase n=1 Tax=Ophiocordyceps polyrhachis-furcata BCC 54312 TaxID=1330021 RepID=A0A367L6W7_9HYPO|nr:hypothetical protein L249_8629 [Ophiocordyceps polyrhachis-furcata BCC 54312]
MAGDLMTYYQGNQPGHTPGLLFLAPDPEPWWWAGGVLFSTMIDYWHFTKDAKYNDVVKAAMVHQSGANQDFLTPNWTAHMGNDDQGFWGMSAMLAAETGFDDPKPDEPQWLASAQGVFNTMASPERQDDSCGGGLRWQINFYSVGYDYKNSISNGILFNLGARLARYTGNGTYGEWADKIWNWERSVGLMTDAYAVYDGGHIYNNCTQITVTEYTYNSATNGDEKWRKRVEGLLDHMLTQFFPKNIITETSCQNDEINTCTRDRFLHKGVSLRWLTTIAQLAPFTAAKITPVLEASAKAAVSQCTGGDNGRMCGFQWSSGTYDGTANAGTQMTALSAVLSVLYQRGRGVAPLTHDTGGTSRGDPGAGSNDGVRDLARPAAHSVTTAGKVGAGFLTIFLLVSILGVEAWIVLD